MSEAIVTAETLRVGEGLSAFGADVFGGERIDEDIRFRFD